MAVLTENCLRSEMAYFPGHVPLHAELNFQEMDQEYAHEPFALQSSPSLMFVRILVLGFVGVATFVQEHREESLCPVSAGLDEIARRHHGQTAIVVTHGGVLQVLYRSTLHINGFEVLSFL